MTPSFIVHIRYPIAYVIIAFLIGSIPFGLLVGRLFFQTDIREIGSGNIGAANALRTMGRKAGIAVLVLDALKGVVATLLPLLVVNATATPTFALCGVCGLMAILGHCYSPFLRFRGGKGVATFLGTLFVAGWPSALVFVVIWTAIVLPTGFASLGSMVGALGAIVVVAILKGSWTLDYSIPAVAIIVWKHRENISRLMAGNENRLNLLGKGNKAKDTA